MVFDRMGYTKLLTLFSPVYFYFLRRLPGTALWLSYFYWTTVLITMKKPKPQEAKLLLGPDPRCPHSREEAGTDRQGPGHGRWQLHSPGPAPGHAAGAVSDPSSLPPDQRPSHFPRLLSVNGRVADPTQNSWLRGF